MLIKAFVKRNLSHINNSAYKILALYYKFTLEG